jgi:hypothetical protein
MERELVYHTYIQHWRRFPSHYYYFKILKGNLKMKLLTENWAEAKSSLLEGLSAEQAAFVAPVLENQRKVVLAETATLGSTQSHDIAGIRKIMLPLARRVMTGSIATEFVGIQPMKSRVGQVVSLRYVYEEAATDPQREALFGQADIAAGDEAFANDKVYGFYSGGTGAPQTPGASGHEHDPALADVAGAPTGFAWGSSMNSTNHENTSDSMGTPVGGTLFGGSGSHIEGSGGRKMSLETVAQAVEAQTRRLQASWTTEAATDADMELGINIENEMTTALSSQIISDIDGEIIADLYSLAGVVSTFDFAATGGPNYAPTNVADRFSNLNAVINYVSNEIGRRTRLGAANKVLTSPMITSVLQSSRSLFQHAPAGSFEGVRDSRMVGKLNGSTDVYSYLHNASAPLAGGAGTDTILLAFKGEGQTNAGYYYCPYVPVTSTGVLMNSTTFQNVVSLSTRYGKAAFTNAKTSLGNSSDYYGKITITNLAFV